MAITRPLDSNSSTSGQDVSLRDVKEDVSQLKADTVDYATRAAEKGIEAAKQGTDAAVETSKKLANKAADAHEGMCDYVREHPTTSVLIAIGVGAIASRLLPRR